MSTLFIRYQRFLPIIMLHLQMEEALQRCVPLTQWEQHLPSIRIQKYIRLQRYRQRHFDHHFRRYRRRPSGCGQRFVPVGFHRRDRTSVCDLHYCDRDAGDGFCCLHRKRTTPYYRQLCKTSGRRPYLRRPELLSSFEDKHGQRDSADLCIFADSLPGYFSQLVYQRRLHSLDS